MRTLAKVVVLVGLVTLAQGAMAQQGDRGPGPGPGAGRMAGGRYMRLFDAKTVGTFTGDVVKVEKKSMMDGMTGIHAVFKTKDGEFSLHLGPDWFIENQDMKIAAGDKLEVLGSKASTPMGAAIIAMEVKRGDDVMKLRDAAGVPFWVAWRNK